MTTSPEELMVAILKTDRNVIHEVETLQCILVNAGICTAKDIVAMRKIIDATSPSLRKIDKEIEELGRLIKRKQNINIIARKLYENPESLSEEEKKSVMIDFMCIDGGSR